MKILCFLGATLLLFSPTKSEVVNSVHYQPEQIHLAFGEKLNDIVVTWSTMDDTETIVKYGENSTNQQVVGEKKIFVDDGKRKRSQWIHTATLKDLKFNTRYVYYVGSELGWSSEFSFKTVPEGDDWVLRFAVFGDMGNSNAMSLPYLQEDTFHGIYDFMIHVGDMAYDMYEEDGQVGDVFMNQIQPIAAYLPYMTCPGNHENAYNFSHYKNRFSMPGDREGMYHSWNAGPVHFISISTEHYYYLNYGMQMVANQYEWLIKDLEMANTKENREKRPWIVLYGHRPMYCSNSDDINECDHEITRTGLPIVRLYGLEKLIYKYNVDLVIWAHEHSYERTWPLYDKKVYNGSLEAPYTNPKAPVHIISGSAGCREGTDKYSDKYPAWSAFRSSDYGYGRMNIYNKTHLYYEQLSVVNGSKVIDSMWIVKDKHEYEHID